VPVGYLVFSSDTRSLGEIQDLALFRIRPMFGTLPGVSAPPPFGGNQRTVVVRVDPDRLRAYHMSGDEVVRALARGNAIKPSGNVRIGDFTQMVPVNSVVPDVRELVDIPVRVGAGPMVDESTVAIENIHTRLARGKTRARAVFDAVSEVAVPMMLAMLCILAVFAPSFFMVGVGRALFVPLALSVGFAMAASYILALTFVPILYTWIGGEHHGPAGEGFFDRFRRSYGNVVGAFVRLRWLVLPVYLVACGAFVYFVGGALGTEIFPNADSGRSLVAATSSSRFVTPNYWTDPNSGVAYQVQVKVPQHTMSSVEDVMNVPIMQNGAARPLLGDVATVEQAKSIGEYVRYNQQRMITLTANVSGQDLGNASEEVFAAVARAGDPAGGVTVNVRGQVAPMRQRWKDYSRVSGWQSSQSFCCSRHTSSRCVWR
jgi:multidrug efflux pump subunit AcrB